jgi:hypothetical protein
MIKIGYSDPPRARRIAGYVTWLLLLSGLWMIINFAIRARDNPDAKPAETDGYVRLLDVRQAITKP